MKHYSIGLIFCLGLFVMGCQPTHQTILTSPDQQLRLEFTLTPEGSPGFTLQIGDRTPFCPFRLLPVSWTGVLASASANVLGAAVVNFEG